MFSVPWLTSVLHLQNFVFGGINILFIYNFFKVIFEKLGSGNKDYFLHYKYDRIRKYYGEHCLDIGAGTGRFSLHLQDNSHEVVPIDIVDKSVDDVEIEYFDGASIPKADNSFDTSIFMFVLHHTDTQIELLKEAARVTKDYIIIAEDIVENRLGQILGNIHLNTSPWEKGNDSFRSRKGWLKIFEENDLELVEAIDIPVHVYPVYPIPRTIFVLKPK